MIGVTADRVGDEIVLFCIRMASCNQIFDPWIYTMCHVPRIRRVKSKVKTTNGCKNNATFPLHTLGYGFALACPEHLPTNYTDGLICTLQFIQPSSYTIIYKLKLIWFIVLSVSQLGFAAAMYT